MVVFMTAAVGCMMSPAPSGNPGVRATTKMWPFKQDVAADDAGSGCTSTARTRGQMPNLPDVAAATPEQRAAAADLLRRTEAGTAALQRP